MKELLSEEEKGRLIDVLTEELPSLRAKIGFSQDDLCESIGISRQTYGPIENKRKRMSWNTFLSLLMFYMHNEKTAPIIDTIGAFPDDLKDSFNVSKR